MTPSIELTTPQILQIAQVCEYLTVVDSQKNIVFKGGDINQRQARLIYMERLAVLNRYTLNPSDTTLIATGNYLFSLLRNWPYAQNILNNIAGGAPTITNPSNQSVVVGGNATFTVAVTSSTAYTVQWFANGVLIPGATSLSYTLSNAQLANSGTLYNAVATNAAGNASSLTASLTVTAGLVGYLYQGAVDYSANLLAANDDVPYDDTFPITTGQPFTVTFPTPGATQYIVVKYPATEPTKVLATNPPGGLDTTAIPSIAWNTTTIGAWKYVFSRTGNPFGLNNVNGEIAFS
jgi:hypothetical protein